MVEAAGWLEAVLGSSSPNSDKSRGADLHKPSEKRPGIVLCVMNSYIDLYLS